jgi:release factor glutamine methyltransferase
MIRPLKLLTPSDVYKPAEDTFLLLDNLEIREGESVLEVGCGNGIIALTAAQTAGWVVATDINSSAIEAVKRNAELNGLDDKVEARVGSLFTPVVGERFDLIIFNPPYLPQDSREKLGRLELAWSGGPTGREVTDMFIENVGDFLMQKGRILLVQSSLSAGEKTIENLRGKGFSVRVLGKKKLEFETLLCIEAQLKQ